MFRYLPSPHADDRPPATEVDLLVVHAISLPPGEFGGRAIDDFFLGRLDPSAHPYFATIASMRVSAHFLVDRQGGITQYVPVLRRAWHAGVSQWKGRERCNDFSVGVELEGDGETPFEARQYECLATLFRTLQTGLPGLTAENVTGHQHIAPERKWDPGPCFDWARLHQDMDMARPEPSWPVVWR